MIPPLRIEGEGEGRTRSSVLVKGGIAIFKPKTGFFYGYQVS